MRQSILFAASEDQSPSDELESDSSEQEEYYPNAEDIPPGSITYFHSKGTGGKPGLISFYNRPYKRVDEEVISGPPRNQNSVLWFIGPSILVASFIFPSLYLRRILSTVFEDSLLTGEDTFGNSLTHSTAPGCTQTFFFFIGIFIWKILMFSLSLILCLHLYFNFFRLLLTFIIMWLKIYKEK